MKLFSKRFDIKTALSVSHIDMMVCLFDNLKNKSSNALLLLLDNSFMHLEVYEIQT